jgi:Prokaryotic N-terminal methylation motif
MTRTRRRRRGVTLMEVLIATGILAIGIIATLALFPIGAVSMARAINQSRSSDHGANSDAVFRLYWKKAWLDPNGGGLRQLDTVILPGPPPITVLGARDIEPMMIWLDSAGNPPVRIISPQASQPSFPVLVDPIGVRTQSGLSSQVVGGVPAVNFPPALYPLPTRATLSAAQADSLPRSTIRLTTLLDDMSYLDAEPSAATGQIDRGGRYNVSWLIQRPKNNVPHEVHLTVLVFAGRAPTDTPSNEYVVPVSVTTGVKEILVNYQAAGYDRPPIRKGGWIAHSYMTVPRGAGAVPITMMSFYRVAGVNDDTAGVMGVELETPIKYSDTGPVQGTEFVVVFENLMEVFDRGVVSPSAISGR